MARWNYEMDRPMITFGKYNGQGKTIRMLIEAGDISYLKWMLEKTDCGFSQEIMDAIARHDSTQKPQQSATPPFPPPASVPAASVAAGPVTQLNNEAIGQMRNCLATLRQNIVKHPILGEMVVGPIDLVALARITQFVEELAVRSSEGTKVEVGQNNPEPVVEPEPQYDSLPPFMQGGSV